MEPKKPMHWYDEMRDETSAADLGAALMRQAEREGGNDPVLVKAAFERLCDEAERTTSPTAPPAPAK